MEQVNIESYLEQEHQQKMRTLNDIAIASRELNELNKMQAEHVRSNAENLEFVSQHIEVIKGDCIHAKEDLKAAAISNASMRTDQATLFGLGAGSLLGNIVGGVASAVGLRYIFGKIEEKNKKEIEKL
eukprot:TRINITY_DN7377_c0_g2_i1.p1 TRINITY_DN7377_c0_g2~~TRINITY_DN7377_c0_g2_i1.p1  ORF type:complete len:128 (+),score=25.49 TRINITY_DN7377_c0_g2_i1:136-519(+)